MLFYFNIIEGAVEITDPEGTELHDEGAAQVEARVIVSELTREFPDRFGMNSVVEIFSEDGRRVLRCPFK